MQWTLMKPVWRNHLINQLLLAYLIMTNYSVIIFEKNLFIYNSQNTSITVLNVSSEML